ncbi:DUF1289 domain-containing protein [Pseudaeromonas sp. ZJS20]|uniref:DUF1289 domain-containing protein n=1 Tax=Pseudaeromonas aegiceratis TaxID=3153928 RepID=UPI00390C6225
MNKPISPCRQQCQLVGDLCRGCGRTLQEIANWSVLSEAARNKVMDALAGRLTTHACPDCGEPSFCAMKTGEPAEGCWCMSLPPGSGNAAPAARDPCLCRRCLARRRAGA